MVIDFQPLADHKAPDCLGIGGGMASFFPCNDDITIQSISLWDAIDHRLSVVVEMLADRRMRK